MIDRPLDLTLAQMVEAIRNMRDFVGAATFEEYARDAKMKHAVERCVEIIAEAARRMPQSIQEKHAQVPWDDIKGIGNILRHGYDSIDDRIIWGVMGRHLDLLEETLRSIATEHGINLAQR